VAGLTPPDHEVVYREFGELPPEGELEHFDLVGISSFTAQIDEAYELAGRYRQAKVPVVLGGIHVTLNAQEAAGHADAIVLGGAEGAWPRLVADADAGRMQARYQGCTDGVFEAPQYARPRFDLLAGRDYNRVTVQTSRGCPRDCEFCAASLRITDRFQQKPVELVMQEVDAALDVMERPFVEFADDNSFVDKVWGKEFLRQIQKRNCRWFTETDISVADDPELLDLMADSGCRQLLIGLESPSAEGLAGIDRNDWKLRQSDRYLEAIDAIQSRGITVNGCFIVGLDTDTPDIFPAIRDFVRESRLLEVQVTVLTPFPGTPLYLRLAAAGRLRQQRFWDRCTLFDVNHRPANMSIGELEAGLRWLFANLYNEDELRRRRRDYMDIVKLRRAA